jgi:hypothetical protein
MKLDRYGLMASMEKSPLADSFTAIFWMRCKDTLDDMVGWCLEKIKAPALLKEFELVDPETNETIYLSTGRRYSVLHIRGKRFFFSRAGGVLDGTCTSLQESVSNGLELRD